MQPLFYLGHTREDTAANVMTASHGEAILTPSPVAHGARDVASETYGFMAAA